MYKAEYVSFSGSGETVVKWQGTTLRRAGSALVRV